MGSQGTCPSSAQPSPEALQAEPTHRLQDLLLLLVLLLFLLLFLVLLFLLQAAPCQQLLPLLDDQLLVVLITGMLPHGAAIFEVEVIDVTALYILAAWQK